MTLTRKLTALEKKWCLKALLDAEVARPDICERAVEKTLLISTLPQPYKLHGPRSLIAHIALSQRAVGITLGRKVYITSRLFDEDGGLPLSLVIHEVTHVAQYFRDGHLGFLARYLKHYAQGLARGLKDHEAYLAIPHEVEARRVEDYLKQHIHDRELAQVRTLYH